MALITMRQLLDDAAENDYALPAFNVNNLEYVQAVMRAADATDSPVILQASRGARSYAGDGFLRHLGGILAETDVLCDDHFWGLVRACIAGHAADHPELAGAAATYDLLRAEFAHSCLNRLQLRNTLQMVDLADQAESLIFAGTLPNPASAG